jgi:hypothetical protein
VHLGVDNVPGLVDLEVVGGLRVVGGVPHILRYGAARQHSERSDTISNTIRTIQQIIFLVLKQCQLSWVRIVPTVLFASYREAYMLHREAYIAKHALQQT